MAHRGPEIMVDLVLNRRLDARNILLAYSTRGERVGRLLPDGDLCTGGPGAGERYRCGQSETGLD